jgi:EmrB/QacA subfamily drug resistance transporter
LILFRGLQGIGAGMVLALLFTIVGDIFSPLERGRYQGFFAAVWGIASIFGPTLGGWLTDHWSWRACFWVNLPVGIVAITAIYFEFPNMKPQRTRRQLDWAGYATLIGTIVPLLLALTWATQYGWTSMRVESLIALSAVMLALFLYVESRAPEPVIPLVLFRNPIISICSVCAFVLGVGMFGVIIYLPLFMQGVLGVTATQSGNLLTPLMMGAVVGSVTAGQTASRTGRYKALGIAGAMLIAAGMILFARMSASTTPAYVVYSMVISGLGMGLLQPVYTLAVQNVAPPRQMGAATSSTIFFRSIGSTVGVAAFGTILLTRYHAIFEQRRPAYLPAAAKPYFSNPLLLMQVRPQMEAAFAERGGTPLLNALFAAVRTALESGLHLIFVASAVMMGLAVLLHVALRAEPLRARAAQPEQAAAELPAIDGL